MTNNVYEDNPMITSAGKSDHEAYFSIMEECIFSI